MGARARRDGLNEECCSKVSDIVDFCLFLDSRGKGPFLSTAHTDFCFQPNPTCSHLHQQNTLLYSHLAIIEMASAPRHPTLGTRTVTSFVSFRRHAEGNNWNREKTPRHQGQRRQRGRNPPDGLPSLSSVLFVAGKRSFVRNGKIENPKQNRREGKKPVALRRLLLR